MIIPMEQGRETPSVAVSSIISTILLPLIPGEHARSL